MSRFFERNEIFVESPHHDLIADRMATTKSLTLESFGAVAQKLQHSVPALERRINLTRFNAPKTQDVKAML